MAIYDVAIRGGRVVDGAGNPWFYSDIGVRDGKIVRIGNISSSDADKVIDAGGLVVWIQMVMGEAEEKNWGNWFDGFAQPEIRKALIDALTEGTHGFELWPDCDPRDGDAWIVKNRFSAFIQGSSDIGELLKAHDIDTLLVTGTVTNVCCESTARDAAMLNYKVESVEEVWDAIAQQGVKMHRLIGVSFC